MSESVQAKPQSIVLALTVVAILATAILALTDLATREPIAEAQRAAIQKGLLQVLPAHANDPLADLLEAEWQGQSVRVYLGRNKSGRITGLAWNVTAPDGYAGSIHILMGVSRDGAIHAIRITDHRETPGLGDGIVNNQAWLDHFGGATLVAAKWAVKKDGGDFDQFTGATITPRAVVAAVKRGLEFFAASRKTLLAGKEE